MKLSTKLHGTFDYSIAIFLIFASFIIDFEEQFLFLRIAIVVGIAMTINNLLTDYEFGWLRIYTMELHLIIDMVLAIILLTASWFWEASGVTLILFIIVSSFQALTSFFTNSRPSTYKTNNFKSLKINIE